jgi:hypothetical protein
MKKDTREQNLPPPLAKNKSANSPAKILPFDGSIARRYVRCGKENCRCQSGNLHGPYVYVRVYREGVRRWQYVRNGDVDSFLFGRDQQRKKRKQVKQEQALFHQEWRELKSLLRSMGL